MPKPGFTYEIQKDQFFTGWAIDQPKHDLNAGIALRTVTCMGVADFFATCGQEEYPRIRSDTSQSWKSIPSFKFNNFLDLYHHCPMNCVMVGVELCDRAIDLERFEWEPRTMLVFGGEAAGLSKEAQKMCRKIIKLPSTGCSMNLSSSMAIVAYSRYLWLKNNNYNIRNNEEPRSSFKERWSKLCENIPNYIYRSRTKDNRANSISS